MRTRSLIRVLSRELFLQDLPLTFFPRMKSIRGLGLTDVPRYAAALETRFDYRNTYHDREPKFDLMRPPEDWFGQFDFVIVSEVLEHVPAPAIQALRNAFQLLKPEGGVVVMTVPYSIERAPSKEHFPALHEWAITQLGGRSVLVNRRADGGLEVFDDLVFHIGETPALEMREYSEQGLRQMFEEAGFDSVNWHGDDYPPHGIVWREPWSVPVAIRKGQTRFSADGVREVMSEHLQLTLERNRLKHHRWTRIGRRLGLID